MVVLRNSLDLHSLTLATVTALAIGLSLPRVALADNNGPIELEQRVKRLESFHGILRAKAADPSHPQGRPVQLQTLDGTFYTLYRGVGTEIEVRLSDGTAIEDLTFSSNTGTVLPHGFNPDRVTVVPERRRFVLNARFTDNPMDLTPLLFEVVEPPLPRLRLLVDDRQYNGIDPISARSDVAVEVVPDAGFGRTYPRDARYKIGRVELLQLESDGRVKKLRDYEGTLANADVGIDLSEAPKGERLALRINSVRRINFSNREIPVLLEDQDLVIPIIVR